MPGTGAESSLRAAPKEMVGRTWGGGMARCVCAALGEVSYSGSGSGLLGTARLSMHKNTSRLL